MALNQTPEIFISYAWNTKEDLVNEIFKRLTEEGYKVIRDKEDLGYQGFIIRFMERMGRAHCVVIALSDKYFTSEYCMFELCELFIDSKLDTDLFKERIFVLCLEHIDFRSTKLLNTYVEFWAEKEKQWQASASSSPQQNKIYVAFKNIRFHFSDLFGILGDINTGSSKVFSIDELPKLKEALKRKFARQPSTSSIIYRIKKLLVTKKFVVILPLTLLTAFLLFLAWPRYSGTLPEEEFDVLNEWVILIKEYDNREQADTEFKQFMEGQKIYGDPHYDANVRLVRNPHKKNSWLIVIDSGRGISSEKYILRSINDLRNKLSDARAFDSLGYRLLLARPFHYKLADFEKTHGKVSDTIMRNSILNKQPGDIE